MLENLNVCITLDMIDQNTNSLVTVYEESLFNIGAGNLYNYLLGASGHTGFYVTAATQTNDCGILGSQLLNDIASQNSLSLIQLQELITILGESFDSEWLNFTTSITDQNVISLITNQKVKISLKVKESCVDFCILIDRINMNKRCTRIDSNTLEISTCPSFDLIRVCDNKKSWLTNEDFKHRDFDLKHRDTQYDINNYKLALNSKEVDLDINPAHAIEQDVFCYIQDNLCLLSGTTGTTSGTCGDINIDLNDILTTDIGELTSLKDFNDTISTELIDVKGWKTMSSYPTLRLLYERYINSSTYCGTVSSGFDYCEMMKFSELVGTYWVDLIEQVIPSTTIWGSTYVYGNTIFDQQKFKYKKYTLIPCVLPTLNGNLPSPTTGFTNDVNITFETLSNEVVDPIISGDTGTTTTPPISNNPIGRGKPRDQNNGCNGVGLLQINCGSEFVGTLTVLGAPIVEPPTTGATTGDTTVTECSLVIDAVNVTPLSISGTNDASATVIIVGANGPVTYLWSDGQTTATASNLSAGTYTITVEDTSITGCSDTSMVTIDPPAISIGDCVNGGFVFYLDGNGGGLVIAPVDITGGTSNNHFRWNGEVFPNAAFNGTTSDAFGTGQANTTAIIADYQPPFDELYAAEMADSYIYSGQTYVGAAVCDDGNTYSDWYLPSKDELELARVNLMGVGDLFNDFNFVNQAGSPANYYTSTNVNGTWAWYVTVASWGGPFTTQMTKVQRVRPIRSF